MLGGGPLICAGRPKHSVTDDVHGGRRMFNLIIGLIIGFLASAILSVTTPALAGKRDNLKVSR